MDDVPAATSVPKDLLQGRIAVVTGGGSGIGAATCVLMARAGATVAVLDINTDAAEQTATKVRAAGGTSISVHVDVTTDDSCGEAAREVLGQLGPISILVNNAGIQRRANLDELGYREAYDAVMRVNVEGTINVLRAFLTQLKETRGRVINVGSIGSFVTALSDNSPYYASKGAILQLTKAVAVELAPYGIRVNAVAPGATVTAMTSGGSSGGSKPVVRNLLGRFAGPDEIAGPIAFLASDLAGYVTGIMLPVDGGHLAV